MDDSASLTSWFLLHFDVVRTSSTLFLYIITCLCTVSVAASRRRLAFRIILSFVVPNVVRNIGCHSSPPRYIISMQRRGVFISLPLPHLDSANSPRATISVYDDSFIFVASHRPCWVWSSCRCRRIEGPSSDPIEDHTMEYQQNAKEDNKSSSSSCSRPFYLDL